MISFSICSRDIYKHLYCLSFLPRKVTAINSSETIGHVKKATSLLKILWNDPNYLSENAAACIEVNYKCSVELSNNFYCFFFLRHLKLWKIWNYPKNRQRLVCKSEFVRNFIKVNFWIFVIFADMITYYLTLSSLFSPYVIIFSRWLTCRATL